MWERDVWGGQACYKTPDIGRRGSYGWVRVCVGVGKTEVVPVKLAGSVTVSWLATARDGGRMYATLQIYFGF